MDDLIKDFVAETTENLSHLDIELIKLEQSPDDPDLIGEIFRVMHTIKGTCGFLGLPRLESVAHAGENLLGGFRDGTLKVTPKAISTILESIDRIKAILIAIDRDGAEPEGDDSSLIDKLNEFCEAESGDGAEPEPPASDAEPDESVQAQAPSAEEKIPEAKPQEPKQEAKQEAKQAPKPDPTKPEAAGGGGAATSTPSSSTQTIRVRVDLLEDLMTSVSELVLTRNQLLQILRRSPDSEFTSSLQRLNHVTSELQEDVMKTRMQPIGNAWNALPRIVRDLGQDLDKKINLEMRGAETELDRQILEQIRDPLTHMVRNAADHGLETKAERIAAGKDEAGHVLLNAFHEGGHIVIEITDDGRGLNVDKIKQKAMANGLATEEELADMHDQQIQQFIFRAGFSTAEKVTNVSGRGVGMDVVRTNIEKIGGTIELKSTFGKGSRFTIKIPLTLAIVSVLIVEAQGERFAIPQLGVVELVRATPQSEHKIENINNSPVLRLRERLLPLVDLSGLLHLNGDEENVPLDQRECFIVVTQIGAYRYGIVVDKIFDTEEIVVKPVARILRDIEVFAGCTILGDGDVVMILDPGGIAAATGAHTLIEQVSDDKEKAEASDKETVTSLLLFRAGKKRTLKAVPLALVSRLENIARDKIETSGETPVVQYRERLMPLLQLDPDQSWQEGEGDQPVLVFTDEGDSVGIMVSEIVDIVDQKLSIELKSERPGTMGSAIIKGEATEVIDAGYHLTRAFKEWFGTEANLEEGTGDKRHLLLVDDSAFFLNMLEPLLKVAGYNVTAVGDPQKALDLLGEGETDFDAIISDIEMPGMDGLELVKTIKGNEDWAAIPAIALTSHDSDKYRAKGKEAGFTSYISKYDRSNLVSTLKELLKEKGAA